jgi:chromosome segregation ATPase
MLIKERLNIEKAISELDYLKNKALMETFIEVNKNFSKIFSTLLERAEAGLELENPNNIEDGVRIKIGFGNQWKENLSELSGG